MEPTSSDAGATKSEGVLDLQVGEGSLLDFLNPEGIPEAALLLLATIIVVPLLTRLAARVSDGIVTYRLVVKQVSTLVAFGCYALAAFTAAGLVLELSPEALFALSGSLAVMLGFALKDFVASALASLTILLTRPFQVGDRISFGTHYGEVVEVGLRSVRLVTPDDNLVTIPSSKVLTEPVASANAGSLDCMVVVSLCIPLSADLARAREIVEEAVLASRYLCLGKHFTIFVGTRALGPNVVVELTVRAFVYDARHELAFASDITELALSQFRKEGMLLPGGAARPVADDDD